MILGATLMYFLDPDRGRRRRSIAIDKARKLRRRTQRALSVGTHDLENRVRGGFAEIGELFTRRERDDRKLEARIRTRLGRASSHPRAIEIDVKNGAVTVAGPVLLDEWRRVRHAIRSVRGITELDDRLEIHTVADIPQLTGGHPRSSTAMDVVKGPWSPAARLVVASAGVLCAGVGLAVRGRAGAAVGGVGLAMLGAAVGREVKAQQRGAGNETPAAETAYDAMMEVTGEFEYIS
jgi:hypothetical protein